MADSPEIADLKKALGIRKEINKTVREMKEDIAKAVAEGEADLVKQLRERLSLYHEQVAAMEKTITQQKEIIAYENQRTHSIEAWRQLHHQAIDAIELELDLLEKRHLAEETSVEEYLNAVRVLNRQKAVQEELRDEQEKYTIGVRESVDAAKDLGTQLGNIMSAYGANQIFNYDNILKWSKAMFSAKAGVIGMLSSLASAGLKAFVDSVISLALALDQSESAFRRTTGASADMAREMTNSYETVRESTVSLEQNQEAWGALYTTYTDFTMISQEARKEIGQTTAVLTQLGVNAADSAKGMQVADKMMGQTGTSAAATLRDLSSLAENIGVAPGQLIAQYGQIGPSLSKLGADGSKAFKELARVSKITGLEMQKLLNMTDKFDTFEGAATSAGKLNAALGGNFVNAMDLMMATDPAERFGMIRGALDEAGLSFDDMSYYQRKFYADSLGLDSVGDLALMMSGNMEALGAETEKTSADYEDAAARAAEMASVQESLKAVMQSLIPVIQPLLGFLQGLGNWMSQHIDTIQFVVKWVGLAVLAYKGWKVATMLYEKALKTLAMTQISELGVSMQLHAEALRSWLLAKKRLILDKAETVQLGIMIGLDKAKAVTTGALTAAKNALTAAQNLWTASATRATVIAAAQKVWSIIMIPLTWGLAAAQGALAGASAANVIQWVLLAAAIGLVAYALLASIHSPPLYIAIPLVAAGLWLMSFALAAISGPAGAAAIPLILVGFGLVQIAAAVFIVAVGIGLMAAGFALMFAALEVDKIKAFTGMIATLALAALFLPYAAIGMFALGIGLLSVAFALKFIATKDLEAIALFTESLASIQSGQLLETAKAIKQVAKAMDDIPDKKAFTFTTILQRVEASANAISRAGGAQAYGQATGGARSGGGGGGAAPAAAAPATNQQVTVKLELDGKLLEEKVLNIVDGKFAEAS